MNDFKQFWTTAANFIFHYQFLFMLCWQIYLCFGFLSTPLPTLVQRCLLLIIIILLTFVFFVFTSCSMNSGGHGDKGIFCSILPIRQLSTFKKAIKIRVLVKIVLVI